MVVYLNYSQIIFRMLKKQSHLQQKFYFAEYYIFYYIFFIISKEKAQTIYYSAH